MKSLTKEQDKILFLLIKRRDPNLFQKLINLDYNKWWLINKNGQFHCYVCNKVITPPLHNLMFFDIDYNKFGRSVQAKDSAHLLLKDTHGIFHLKEFKLLLFI